MDVVLFAEDIDHALYILALAMSEKAVLGIDAPIRYFGDLVVEPVESGLEESL